MKKYIVLILLNLLVSGILLSQERIVIHRSGNVLYESSIEEIDSIKFYNEFSVFNLKNHFVEIPVSEIDSITFINEVLEIQNIIYIFYNEDNVTVINPLEEKGVAISKEEGHVIVNAFSGIEDLIFHISGNTEDGSLTIVSDKNFTLLLSNISIVNPSGYAISISSSVITTVHVENGSVNNLADGTLSSKNATLIGNGKIILDGTGRLNVNGYVKHAISSKDFIQIENSSVTISQSASDGFHSEGFLMNGGTLNINASGDAIDAGGEVIEINSGSITIVSTVNDTKGIKTDKNLTINGGTIDMVISGAQSKGFSSKEDVLFNGGIIKIVTSGNTVLESSGNGYDPSYCTAVKSDGNIVINDGIITIESKNTCDGGKGLSADASIIINNGSITITTAGDGATYKNESNITDSYTSCCIKSDENISILGGNINCSSSGKGGKGISADGSLIIGVIGMNDNDLILNVSTSGERFYVSGNTGGGGPGGNNNADYANPKAIKSEGNLTVNGGIITVKCTQSNEGGEGLESKATLNINGGVLEIQAYDDCINASTHIGISGGTIYCDSSGNDGIDSNGTLTISGGFTITNGTRSPEEGFDCDQNIFKITGGIAIGTGGATSTPTSNACTQRSIIYNRATAGNAICIKNSSQEIVLLFQLPTFSGTGGGGPGGGSSQMVVLLTDPNLATGNYTLHYGGTITGGTTKNGYNTGGSYTGGSSRSFTINNMVTTISN